MILLISASQVARVSGMSHWFLAYIYYFKLWGELGESSGGLYIHFNRTENEFAITNSKVNALRRGRPLVRGLLVAKSLYKACSSFGDCQSHLGQESELCLVVGHLCQG
jgi:hypothetical protein